MPVPVGCPGSGSGSREREREGEQNVVGEAEGGVQSLAEVPGAGSQVGGAVRLGGWAWRGSGITPRLKLGSRGLGLCPQVLDVLQSGSWVHSSPGPEVPWVLAPSSISAHCLPCKQQPFRGRVLAPFQSFPSLSSSLPHSFNKYLLNIYSGQHPAGYSSEQNTLGHSLLELSSTQAPTPLRRKGKRGEGPQALIPVLAPTSSETSG